MTDVTRIPGAADLLGRGVYQGLPNQIPQPVRDRNAVVVGQTSECARVARQLGDAGWRVTVVTRQRCRCGVARGCRIRVGTRVVCATGGEYLEAVVLRRVDTRRVDACNVSALFIL